MRRIFHPDGREGKGDPDPSVLCLREGVGGKFHALGVRSRLDRHDGVRNESRQRPDAERVCARVLHGRQFDHVDADLFKQARDLELLLETVLALTSERAVGNDDLFHFLSFLFCASENEKSPKPEFGFRDDQTIAVPP